VRSRAATRAEYLTRPDLGRRLDDDSRAALERLARDGLAVDLTLDIDPDADPRTDGDTTPGALDGDAHAPTLCVVVGDGLSAVAGQSHAAALIDALQAALHSGAGERVAIGTVVVATQARVALGDEIGALLQAPLVLMLLGERPGLSSPDSLGAYLTWAPEPGRADSERNCVSNIRPDGLALPAAAGRIAWLVRESLRRRVTGIALKDDSEVAALDGDGNAPAALPGA
jgi:ethanolamine ammonia-lyase small subunit